MDVEPRWSLIANGNEIGRFYYYDTAFLSAADYSTSHETDVVEIKSRVTGNTVARFHNGRAQF